ncbi:hypothetical protein STSP2_01901 [Anaerohalosphaera lusitana]|uniref:Uncharacterized protein n=1 Tax=Anaerohalosphaera lusitana TaxID=1936003 RepID=A0A1U9NLD8_9BACT|nr:hypothetical protein [Anaerohalosphaera lusitana]AQT68729.1 hypothetical protein STSP2_01901 [Anaerohalosphaera lusitana]
MNTQMNERMNGQINGKMNRPKARFQAGSVTVAVWENEFEFNGKPTRALRASIERRFKAKDGQWKSSSTFSRNDLPLAIHCMQKAFDYMVPNGFAGQKEVRRYE